MAYDAINPIYKIGNSTTDSLGIPPPSSYVWKLEDTSAADAGRTEDGVMHKKRIGQVVGLELSWQNVTTAQAHAILTAFQPEYVTVTYIDPQFGTGTNYLKENMVFYVGNRSAPMYNWTKKLWSNISFNLIDRNGAMK